MFSCWGSLLIKWRGVLSLPLALPDLLDFFPVISVWFLLSNLLSRVSFQPQSFLSVPIQSPILFLFLILNSLTPLLILNLIPSLRLLSTSQLHFYHFQLNFNSVINTALHFNSYCAPSQGIYHHLVRTHRITFLFCLSNLSFIFALILSIFSSVSCVLSSLLLIFTCSNSILLNSLW